MPHGRPTAYHAGRGTQWTTTAASASRNCSSTPNAPTSRCERTSSGCSAREIYTGLYGPEHPAVAKSLDGLGLLYYNTDRKEEAIELMHEAVRINREAYADDGHPQLATMLQNLGAVLAHENDAEGIEVPRIASAREKLEEARAKE
ncbi:MAG: tetratricopeptide repeat protein [bacterium]|nr:tetratricopeptide repeat protein [bacterium]